MALSSSGNGPVGAPHLSGYAARDHEVIDYRMVELPGTGLWFRGPLPESLAPGSFVACLGAAQTFGCFCEEPYPRLLERELGLPVLNLGYGGAGPAFFAGQPALLELVNRARAVVVQVMSARSESNSRFESGGLEYLRRRSDGAWLGAELAWQQFLDGEHLWPARRARLMRWCARRAGRLQARALVAETRRRWVESSLALARALRVPSVLLWFSRRTPRYSPSLRHVGSLFGEYPQLVTAEMVARLRPAHARYVECVTSRGLPQLLCSRFTGLPCRIDPSRDRHDLAGPPWTHNHYYPAPQMHADACAALAGHLQDLLEGHPSR